MEMLVEMGALLCLIAISAFFAACETSFLSVSTLRVHALLEKGAQGAESLSRLRQKRRHVLITLLIGNNVANIAASAVATTIALSFFGNNGLSIAIGVMSFVMLTIGDIMPKSFATSYSEGIILACAPMVEGIYYAFYPLVLVFEFINRVVPGVYSRATGIERFTEEEIKAAVKLGATHKSITEREREIIENVLAFNDKTVAHAMTPKARVVSFASEMLASEALQRATHSLYYRFPVTKDGAVVGTVNIRALAKASAGNPGAKLENVALPVVKVRSTDLLNEAFAHLQESKRHFAIVENERGNFVGVLTMDDLLEELVGKIKMV